LPDARDRSRRDGGAVPFLLDANVSIRHVRGVGAMKQGSKQ
jgi:hypothetical protein